MHKIVTKSEQIDLECKEKEQFFRYSFDLVSYQGGNNQSSLFWQILRKKWVFRFYFSFSRRERKHCPLHRKGYRISWSIICPDVLCIQRKRVRTLRTCLPWYFTQSLMNTTAKVYGDPVHTFAASYFTYICSSLVHYFLWVNCQPLSIALPLSVSCS